MHLTNRLPESILQDIHDLPKNYQKQSNSRLDDILTKHNQFVNGPLQANSSIIPTVCTSASEAEYAALYKTGQLALWLRIILEELGYPQPPTIIFCDNAVATGIANDSVKLKHSKTIDLRYHWIRDQVSLGHFIILWRHGACNKADFFTKPTPVAKFNTVKPFLVRLVPNPNNPSLPPRIRRNQAFRAQSVM